MLGLREDRPLQARVSGAPEGGEEEARGGEADALEACEEEEALGGHVKVITCRVSVIITFNLT